MVHVSVTNRRFSVKYATTVHGNSAVGHKFFVTGGVKREMDIADINGAYAILSKCISPFLYRAATSASERERARARNSSDAINEKKAPKKNRQRQTDRPRERDSAERFYLFKSSSPEDSMRARSLWNSNGIETDRPGRPARETNALPIHRRLLLYSRARNLVRMV